MFGIFVNVRFHRHKRRTGAQTIFQTDFMFNNLSGNSRGINVT